MIMPNKLPYYNYELNTFFKNLYYLNQMWFKVRKQLTDFQGNDLEALVYKIKPVITDIEIYLSNVNQKLNQQEAQNGR